MIKLLLTRKTPLSQNEYGAQIFKSTSNAAESCLLNMIFFLPLVALVEVPILKHGFENLKTDPKL